MGNCPACLLGRYSIHDTVSEEGDEIGELRSSNGGIKVVRVTDGKVFEYKTTSGSDGDDDVDDRHMQHLRAKDVISMVQGAEESSNLLYALFDQSYSMAGTDMISNSSTGRNEKMKQKKKKILQLRKKEECEEKGYDSKPLHPETLLKISHVYYLRPASAATTANYEPNIFSSASCPASAQAAAAAIKPATDKKKRKQVRFSDHVVFIEPPAPSSGYKHHRQHLDCIHSPPTQLAAVLPSLAAAPLSKGENMAQAQKIVGRDDDHDDGAAIEKSQLGTAKGPVVRVKLLLSKRELCDLLAATGQYQKQHHSQLAAPDVLAEKLVAPWLPPHLAEQLVSSPQFPSSLLSPTNKPIRLS